MKVVSGVCFLITNAVGIKPELLSDGGISEVSSFHVDVGHGDWNDKVDIKVVDHICNETHEDDEASVLEVSDLNIHSSEFNSPPYVRFLVWWWLESQGVPVGGLEVLKMHSDVVVVDMLFHELTFVSRDWISGE